MNIKVLAATAELKKSAIELRKAAIPHIVTCGLDESTTALLGITGTREEVMGLAFGILNDISENYNIPFKTMLQTFENAKLEHMCKSERDCNELYRNDD